jgi:hypothetical protein
MVLIFEMFLFLALSLGITTILYYSFASVIYTHYKFTEYSRFNFCLVIFVYIIAALITAHFIKFN